MERALPWLVGASLVSLYVLSAQSASSVFTYFTLLAALATVPSWWPSLHRAGPPGVIAVVLLLYLPVTGWWSEGWTARDLFSMFLRAVLIFAFLVGWVVAMRGNAFLPWLARAVALVAVGAAGAAFVAFSVDPPPTGRLLGLGQLDNEVVAGLAFGAATLFALQVARGDRGKWRWFGFAAAAGLAATVGLTGSRGPLIALIAAIAVLVAARAHTSARTIAATLATALLSGFLAAVALRARFPDLEAQLLERGASFRPDIWAASWAALVEDGVVFGRGILTDDDLLLDGLEFRHPHSLYLAVAMQGGIVALVLFLALLVVTARELFLARATPGAALALSLLTFGAVAYAVDGWELIDKVGMSWLLVWLPVAMSIAASSRRQAVAAASSTPRVSAAARSHE